MSGLSLKVPIQTLIGKVEAERTGIIKKHEADLKAYNAAVGAARKELAAKLREKAKNISTASLSFNRDYRNNRGYVEYASVSVRVDCPAKPSPKPDTSRVDRDLRLLKATSQAEITVRADSDLSRYL